MTLKYLVVYFLSKIILILSFLAFSSTDSNGNSTTNVSLQSNLLSDLVEFPLSGYNRYQKGNTRPESMNQSFFLPQENVQSKWNIWSWESILNYPNDTSLDLNNTNSTNSSIINWFLPLFNLRRTWVEIEDTDGLLKNETTNITWIDTTANDNQKWKIPINHDGKYQVNLTSETSSEDQEKKLISRLSLLDSSKHWPNAHVPYKIGGTFSENDIEMIINAIHEYSIKTCISFETATSEDKDYVLITNQETGCNSPVGRQGGEQLVNLGKGCMYFHTILHELMHSLGFDHEHNRPDRDEYIVIYRENIQRGMSFAFRKQNNETTTSLGFPYDFHSVMQYAGDAFSKNGKTTMRAKANGILLGPIGEQFSEMDIAKLNKLYCMRGDNLIGKNPSTIVKDNGYDDTIIQLPTIKPQPIGINKPIIVVNNEADDTIISIPTRPSIDQVQQESIDDTIVNIARPTSAIKATTPMISDGDGEETIVHIPSSCQEQLIWIRQDSLTFTQQRSLVRAGNDSLGNVYHICQLRRLSPISQVPQLIVGQNINLIGGRKSSCYVLNPNPTLDSSVEYSSANFQLLSNQMGVKLLWKAVAKGDVLLANAIPSSVQDKIHYIARCLLKLNDYKSWVVGSALVRTNSSGQSELRVESARVAFNNQLVECKNYQLLTCV